MTAPQTVLDLVDLFTSDLGFYKSATYNETQARQEFIDPIFEALGWDIGNRGRAAALHREVVLEYSMKIGEAVKAPDYLFQLSGSHKFFVEAKKPAVNLLTDLNPAFQLRRYAWSATLPLSVLTDFEEFAIYDCRVEPVKADKATVARLLYIPYTEYATKWDTIAELFSREAVLGGSLDRFAQEQKAPKGSLPVDKALLAEIDGWRTLLAKNIAAWNEQLTQQELNYTIQMTLDRILFLRICEDRGVEPYGKLQDLLKQGEIYKRLCDEFRRADDRYNSGLFHFGKEKGREDPDGLTLGLHIDDEPLRKVLRGLYYPDSPYEFSVLPVEVLGNVYEQFLGKVITIGTGRKVEVDEKPEVRKAGGVYYTPAYIVDYIVKNTVGKLLEGKRPQEVEKIRVVDPACGSGSFLLGAYQYLLDWHLDWYGEYGTARQKRDALYQGPNGDWRLTTKERRRILVNTIYGVDLDTQAVEVTKLSLCLKMLEGETAASLGSQMQMFQERALPDLGGNIKCGNSLIAPDFYSSPQASQLADDELYRINAFDWAVEFPTVMRVGGFDAVVGNPPYIRIQTMKEWAPIEVEEYKRRYSAARQGNYDIYVVFVERGLSLLNQNGHLGFILPHKFFNSQYGEPLRELVANGSHLQQVVHFGHQQVFEKATTYTCLLFLNRTKQKTFDFSKVDDLMAWRQGSNSLKRTINAAEATSAEWNFSAGSGAELFTRIQTSFGTLGAIADIFVGLQTSADTVYIMDYLESTPDGMILHSQALNADVLLESHLLQPIVSGTDVVGYRDLPARQYILFPYAVHHWTATLIDFEYIKEHYPKTAAYLWQNKKQLEDRERGKFKGAAWYRFGRNQNLGIQSRIKLCVPRLVNHLHAAFDIDGTHYLDNVDVGGITLKSEYENQGLIYLLGLLNSKLLRWFFPFVSAPFRGGYWSANRQFLGQVPIRTINFSDPADKARHDQMVTLVERMLDLHKRLPTARTPQEKTMLQRQIEAADQQIDKLVYALYELTPDEVAIVEEATT